MKIGTRSYNRSGSKKWNHASVTGAAEVGSDVAVLDIVIQVGATGVGSVVVDAVVTIKSIVLAGSETGSAIAIVRCEAGIIVSMVPGNGLCILGSGNEILCELCSGNCNLQNPSLLDSFCSRMIRPLLQLNCTLRCCSFLSFFALFCFFVSDVPSPASITTPSTEVTPFDDEFCMFFLSLRLFDQLAYFFSFSPSPTAAKT
eukprot:Gb_25714 [translate_table: standard]